MTVLEGWRKFAGMMLCVIALTLLGLFDKIAGDAAANYIMVIFSAYVVGNVMADHMVKRLPKQ